MTDSRASERRKPKILFKKTYMSISVRSSSRGIKSFLVEFNFEATSGLYFVSFWVCWFLASLAFTFLNGLAISRQEQRS